MAVPMGQHGDWYKAPWINKCCDVGAAAQSRHSGRRPAIRAFSEISTASRGWQAFARHDDERLAALVKRLGYFTTSPNRCLSE
jgi:hypothetical protein